MPAASSSPSRWSSEISRQRASRPTRRNDAGMQLVSAAGRPDRPGAGERVRVRRAHPRPDAGDEVRAAPPPWNAVTSRPSPANAPSPSPTRAQVVAVERGAERPDQRAPSPAGTASSPRPRRTGRRCPRCPARRAARSARTRGRARHVSQRHRGRLMRSRTGRPVRRSTRYASPGRQSFESRARKRGVVQDLGRASPV